MTAKFIRAEDQGRTGRWLGRGKRFTGRSPASCRALRRVNNRHAKVDNRDEGSYVGFGKGKHTVSNGLLMAGVVSVKCPRAATLTRV
jgi:hypothetical protein